MGRLRARRAIENRLRRLGFRRIAGVDEAGRGCLAGPVVAAAVVLDPERPIPGLADSKLLEARTRERLYDLIVERAVWAVGSASAEEIDALNIHRAGLEAMRRAVLALRPLPDFVLVDGRHALGLAIPQRTLVQGDRRAAAVAAASIVAKVTRDRVMAELHAADPRYGFDRHKGYATAAHLAAVARFGYSPVHRRSFRPRTLFDRIQ
jgi:ribonuclease HII